MCVWLKDACLLGNDCSSQLSGFHNMLLCGVDVCGCIWVQNGLFIHVLNWGLF